VSATALLSHCTTPSNKHERANEVSTRTRVMRLMAFASTKSAGVSVSAPKKVNREYDAVVITAPPWSLDVTAGFDKFQPKHLPWKVREAMSSSHSSPAVRCSTF